MDMGFDHTAWPLGQDPGAESGTAQDGLDWHGLRARFLAAQGFRQALAPDEAQDRASANASFDRSTARVLASFDDASHDVNQRDSADSKDASGIDEHVAGASTRGDRG